MCKSYSRLFARAAVLGIALQIGSCYGMSHVDAGSSHSESVLLIRVLIERINRDPHDRKSLSNIEEIAIGKKGMEDVQARAIEALATVGQAHAEVLSGEIVTVLIGMSSSVEHDVRRAVAEALGVFGARAKSAVPALLKLVHNGRGQDIEAMAIRSLRLIGEEPELVVPVLAELVPNRDPQTGAAVFIRGEELLALAAFGKRASLAIPKLVSALGDRDIRYRREVVLALAKIDPENVALPEAIRALMKSEDSLARYNALLAVREMNPARVSAEIYRALAEAAVDPDHEIAGLAKELLENREK